MIILTKNADQLKPNQFVELECAHCHYSFLRTKAQVFRKRRDRDRFKYCSISCANADRILEKEKVVCEQCGKNFEKIHAEAKRSPRHFCSRSCSVTYHNLHKVKGTRRSKLEIWIEKKLTELYPNMDIRFNEKSAIDSELDVYIPGLRLAFELNGIFHYEPIYGKDKLGKIQSGDANKFHECYKREISLCVIDVSKYTNFKESKSMEFLEIITNIIDDAMK